MKAEINPGSRGLKHSKMHLLSWLTWKTIPSKHHKKTKCWCYTSYKSADIFPNLGIKIRSWIKAKAWKPFDLITNFSSFCFQYKSTTGPTPISSQSVFKKKHQQNNKPKKWPGGLPIDCCLWFCHRFHRWIQGQSPGAPSVLDLWPEPNFRATLSISPEFWRDRVLQGVGKPRVSGKQWSGVFAPKIGSKIREVTYLRDTSWSLEPLQSRRPKQLWVKTSSKWFKRWSLSLAVQVILRMWMKIYKEENLLYRFCQNLNVWNV